ncbi:MAG: TonB-dependent receptor [Rikenellaceae bacterium]|nr:TonB-dependent receptor [Rikenellaceae bacterium]
MLSGQELQKLSVHSVADAVRYFSGVQIKDYGGIGGLKTVNIRSMGSHHVGVFYDGIQIGNAQNGVVDLGRFSLDNMEAISLYNGQKSTIFQSAKDFASAGSVYLQTKVPVLEADKKNNIRATVKGGSFATINPLFLWEHRINKNISSSASAEFLYTSGKYKFNYSKKDGYDTTEVRKNGDVRLFRAEAGLFGNVKGGDWKAKVYFYNSERGYPGASVREEPGKFRHQDRQWDDNFFAQASFRKKISPSYSILINGKYAYDYLHYLSDPRLDVTTMYINNHYRQQEVYFSSANLFILFDWWTANISGDMQWNKLNADLTDFAYPQRITALGAFATSVNLPWISLQGSILFTHVTDKTQRLTAAAGDKNEWTPSVITSFKPFRSHELYLRAFYKRIFRMPTLNDNYYTFIGNINLDPEFTNQYNIGLAYKKIIPEGWFRNLDVQLDFYYNEVENKIVAMPTSNQFRWTMINLGFVEIRGMDFSATANMRYGMFDMFARLSYTYQKAQDFTDSSSEFYGGQIPYVPWHSGSLILGADYKDWSLNYSFIYTGERYESVANIPENHAQPWYTHDMAISKLLRVRTYTLRFTAEINNIFNQQYEVVKCYPMPGTNFKFIVTFEL